MEKSNVDYQKEIEEMALKWQLEKKPSKIAASFSHPSELQENHIKHFRNAPYVWKPMQGTIFTGMLMDDKISYIHMVLVTKEVLEYILSLKGKPKQGSLQAITASYALTASYVPSVITASYAFTSSYIPCYLSASWTSHAKEPVISQVLQEKKGDVPDYFEKLGYEVTWDFRQSTREEWWEIYKGKELVAQIDMGVPIADIVMDLCQFYLDKPGVSKSDYQVCGSGPSFFEMLKKVYEQETNTKRDSQAGFDSKCQDNS